MNASGNNAAHSVFIAVGSNDGDREANIEKAFEILTSSGDIDITDKSSIREYPAVEQCSGQSPFLNGVIRIKTELPALDLLHRLQVVERRLGRKTKGDGGVRPIDLDILSYEEPVVFSGKTLTLPHPKMMDRDFVLEPLAEIAPKWVHPKHTEDLQSVIQAKKDQSDAHNNSEQALSSS